MSSDTSAAGSAHSTSSSSSSSSANPFSLSAWEGFHSSLSAEKRLAWFKTLDASFEHFAWSLKRHELNDTRECAILTAGRSVSQSMLTSNHTLFANCNTVHECACAFITLAPTQRGLLRWFSKTRKAHAIFFGNLVCFCFSPDLLKKISARIPPNLGITVLDLLDILKAVGRILTEVRAGRAGRASVPFLRALRTVYTLRA